MDGAHFLRKINGERRETKECRAGMIQRGSMLRVEEDASEGFKFKEDGTVEETQWANG